MSNLLPKASCEMISKKLKCVSGLGRGMEKQKGATYDEALFWANPR